MKTKYKPLGGFREQNITNYDVVKESIRLASKGMLITKISERLGISDNVFRKYAILVNLAIEKKEDEIKDGREKGFYGPEFTRRCRKIAKDYKEPIELTSVIAERNKMAEKEILEAVKKYYRVLVEIRNHLPYSSERIIYVAEKKHGIPLIRYKNRMNSLRFKRKQIEGSSASPYRYGKKQQFYKPEIKRNLDSIVGINHTSPAMNDN